jgi:hypothetical protein
MLRSSSYARPTWLLFTDRDDWLAAEVIAACRSQADAEAEFRQLKDRHIVSFSPEVPLGRAEDPLARLLPRARSGHRPPDAPPRRPSRTGHADP